MNESESPNEIRENAPSSGAAFPAILIIGVAAVLVIAGALLFTQTGASVGCGEDWPCMIYFYADG
jgi:hypothetical protein